MPPKIPELVFSRWVIWHDRSQILDCHKGGVYRIALSQDVEPSPDMSWERVRYIGMSVDKGGLIARWRKHDRDIKRAPEERKRFRDQGEFAPETSRFSSPSDSKAGRRPFLYVSAAVVGPSDIYDTDENTEHTDPEIERANGIIKFLEHEAFAQYLEQSKRFLRPKYNVR